MSKKRDDVYQDGPYGLDGGTWWLIQVFTLALLASAVMWWFM